jgi:outer membrane protein assembly factor BamB
MTGYAAATVATDGRRVYAIYANGYLAAFTVEGEQAWAKNLGFPDNPYGHASSLLTWRDRLILQLDHGDPEKRQAKLYAFDGATGQVAWQRARAVPPSWPTPIVISVGDQHQIITLADPWAIAYNAQDGAEIWRAECMAGEVTPSPVFADGMLFLVSPMDQLVALRPDGSGDVSKTHIQWSAHDNIPDITSPVTNGKLVYLLDTMGILTCFDAQNGENLWEHDFETDCHASPTIVGDRLYIFTIEGTCIVAQVGREFVELARSGMGENVAASPAFAHQSIYVRGQKHLFCLGPAGGELANE